MDFDEYDEFGNYIGGNNGAAQNSHHDDPPRMDEGLEVRIPILPPTGPSAGGERSSALIVHDPTRHLPSAQQLFGGAEVLVELEDQQALDRGILYDPDAVPSAMFSAPKNTYQTTKRVELPQGSKFMQELLKLPALQRGIAVLGHLHHGKTSVCDALLGTTGRRFLDARKDEVDREISVKVHPVSLLGTTTFGKTLLATVIDTPGHICFDDEASCATAIVDGVMVVVDVAEGVMSGTVRAIDHVVRQGLPMVLCLNKMDRLIFELHLPPRDAFMKIQNVINTVNDHIAGHPLRTSNTKTVSAQDGNIIFGSAEQGWFFTLHSFAQLYCLRNHIGDSESFARRLWAPWVHAEGRLTKNGRGEASFVALVLEPLYKIASVVISEEVEEVARILPGGLSDDEMCLDTKPLLRVCYERFFDGQVAAPIVDTLWSHIPSPSPEDVDTPLVARVTKFIHFQSAVATEELRMYALTRVVQGNLKKGSRIRLFDCTADGMTMTGEIVLGEIFLSLGRRLMAVDYACAGSIVLLGGISDKIQKFGILQDVATSSTPVPFAPLRHSSRAVVKLHVEPVRPSDMLKVNAGLQLVQQAYPALTFVQEETGLHTLWGTGELYLDSVMRDLRETYAKAEVKVSDPGTSFRETVDRPTKAPYVRHSADGTNAFSFVCNPMEKGIVKAFDMQRLNAKTLRSELNWNALEVKSIWAYGPGPNLLLNDTLPHEVNRVHLESVQEHVQKGFMWAMKEGPLCGEPVYNTRVRLTHAKLSADPLERVMRVVYPTARHGILGAMLDSAPRLMEPVYSMEIQTTSKGRDAIYALMSQRRGKVVSERACPGLPLYILTALVPIIESFGLETEIRIHTTGEAFCQSEFSHWDVVPGGDPRNPVPIKVTEAVPVHKLARDFFLKTRRRKGMSEDISF